MLSRIRTYKINQVNLIDVNLSYESGCDSIKMLRWLKTPQGYHMVRHSNFLVFSLGTNDVANYGVHLSLEHCADIITFIRRSFPNVKAISWMALSPRCKPTRLISGSEFTNLHYQFNEGLRILSKKLNFDVIDANLQLADMRLEDGLHPSTKTGKWKYEQALRKWFPVCATSLSNSASSSFQPSH